jgi:hypothetical protein
VRDFNSFALFLYACKQFQVSPRQLHLLEKRTWETSTALLCFCMSANNSKCILVSCTFWRDERERLQQLCFVPVCLQTIPSVFSSVAPCEETNVRYFNSFALFLYAYNDLWRAVTPFLWKLWQILKITKFIIAIIFMWKNAMYL